MVQSSPEHLARLVGNVPGVLWETRGRPGTPDYVTEYVSPAVERMFGYSIDEWQASPNFWGTIVHPDDRAQVGAKALQHFLEGGGVNRFRAVTKDGRTIWVEAHAQVIYDAQGNPAGLRGVTLDVTGQVRVEAAQQYLADAGKTLSSSLDYEATLQSLAQLTVPRFADWFAVDLLSRDGRAVQLAMLSHRDPAKVELVRELRRHTPIDLQDPKFATHPLNTGKPEFFADISLDVLAAFIDNPAHLAVMRGLGLRSSINVPLIARNQVFGAIGFVVATRAGATMRSICRRPSSWRRAPAWRSTTRVSFARRATPCSSAKTSSPSCRTT